MVTHPNPYKFCHFQLRAFKYRFDIKNELFYIFQLLFTPSIDLKRYKVIEILTKKVEKLQQIMFLNDVCEKTRTVF